MALNHTMNNTKKKNKWTIFNKVNAALLTILLFYTLFVLCVFKIDNLSHLIANWATVASVLLAIYIFLHELAKHKNTIRQEKIAIIDKLIIELRLNQYTHLKSIRESYERCKKEETFPVVTCKTDIIDNIFNTITIRDIEVVKLIMQTRDRLSMINRITNIVMNTFIQDNKNIEKLHFLLDQVEDLSKDLYSPTTIEDDGSEKCYASGIINDLIKELEKLKENIVLEKEWYSGLSK